MTGIFWWISGGLLDCDGFGARGSAAWMREKGKRVGGKGEIFGAVGTALFYRAAPRTDPSVRDYRTGLLPRVLASKRSKGQGCWTFGRGIHRSSNRALRAAVMWPRSLRRDNDCAQILMTSDRSRSSRLPLVGIAW